MEKKLYDLKIDPELRDLIPPLAEEELKMLEDSIVRDGCDTPLIVWHNTIVDGHNRYAICVKHQIPFSIEERSFSDQNAAMFWMLEHQLARRNLNSYQRSELALKFAPMLHEVALGRQGQRNDLNPNFQTNLSGSDGVGYSNEKLADMANVSPSTIKKVKAINSYANEDTKEQLRKGEKSIHAAYTEIKEQEHKGETKVCGRCGKEKPYSEFTLPANRASRSPICKDCEAIAKQAAKEAEAKASLPVCPDEDASDELQTGMAIRDGQLAHIVTPLPDNPDLFEHVMMLLYTATSAYQATCETAFEQLQPSMCSPENIEIINSLIDDTAANLALSLDAMIMAKKESK